MGIVVLKSILLHYKISFNTVQHPFAIKIQHCQNHRQRLKKDTEKSRKFSDTRSVAKLAQSVAPPRLEGEKSPTSNNRLKDIFFKENS